MPTAPPLGDKVFYGLLQTSKKRRSLVLKIEKAQQGIPVRLVLLNFAVFTVYILSKNFSQINEI
jgi:hypothetical protein